MNRSSYLKTLNRVTQLITKTSRNNFPPYTTQVT